MVKLSPKLTLVLSSLLLLAGCEAAPDTKPLPNPIPQPAPSPRPSPSPRPPRPWPNCPRKGTDADSRPQFAGHDALVNGAERNGIHISCDLDPRLHIRNAGGSDGAGLCVFASLHHIGAFNGDKVLADTFDYMKHHPGGGWPEKVDQVIAAVSRQDSLPLPDYVQVTGRDIDLLCAAVSAGHMVGCTYNHSPSGRYGGRGVSHMVNVVHADGENFVVLDNNFPGGDKYEWLTRREFESTKPDWFIFLATVPSSE